MLNVECLMLNEETEADSGPDPIQHSTLNTQHSPSPNWRLLYTLVLGELALTIAIFYAFTKAFA